MIRSACFLGVLLSLSVVPVHAQSVDLRVAMLYGAGLGDTEAGGMLVLSDQMRPEPAVASVALRDTLRDPWLGRDKALHAAGSFLLTLSAQYVLTSKLDMSEDGALPIAAGTSFSFGLAKEVADSQRPVRPLFSVRDLVADALGVALAVGLILL